MEIDKSLLDLANEEDDTKFAEGFSKLSDEDKKRVNGVLADNAKKERDSITAMRQEKQRQEQLIEDQKNKNDQTNKTFEERMREENKEKALSEIFSEFGVDKEEERNEIRKEFELRKPAVVTVENLKAEARKAWAAANPDKAANALKRISELKGGAADFNSTGAGSFGGSDGDDETKKFSPEARQLAQKSGVTLQQAQDYIDEGGLRGNRRFELGKKSREKTQ